MRPGAFGRAVDRLFDEGLAFERFEPILFARPLVPVAFDFVLPRLERARGCRLKAARMSSKDPVNPASLKNFGTAI
jgi:hypothetical protein